MKTYVLLRFEHKNDFTIIIKFHRATRLWLVQSVSWSLAEFRHNKIVQSPMRIISMYVDNTKKSEIS